MCKRRQKVGRGQWLVAPGHGDWDCWTLSRGKFNALCRKSRGGGRATLRVARAPGGARGSPRRGRGPARDERVTPEASSGGMDAAVLTRTGCSPMSPAPTSPCRWRSSDRTLPTFQRHSQGRGTPPYDKPVTLQQASARGAGSLSSSACRACEAADECYVTWRLSDGGFEAWSGCLSGA